MARKLIVMLMSVMILAGFASCDLSDMMKAMGKNVAGANPGKVGKVEEAIDSIWGDEGSGGAVDISDDTEINIGNITLPDWAKESVDSMLSPLSQDDLDELASTIAKAASNDSGRKALQDALSAELDDESDAEKIDATKGSATIIKNMVIKLTDSEPDIEASDLETKLLAGIEGMDPAVSSLLGNLVDGVFSVADYSSDSQTGITKGDLVIMQTVYTVLGNVSDVIFTDGPVDDTGSQHGGQRGLALPAHEGAGDPAHGVELLLEVHAQGEEVHAVPGTGGGGDGHQHGGLAVGDHGGGGGQLGHLAHVDGEGPAAQVHLVGLVAGELLVSDDG